MTSRMGMAIGATLALTADDVTAAVALARSVGWSDDAPEWRVLFDCGDVRGIRDDAGGLAASCAVTDFGSGACVGKMIVRPDARRRGLARSLLQAAMAARPDGALGLVATDDGWPLYRQLGFVDVGEVLVYERAAAPAALAGARPLGDGDWAAVTALDRAWLGCDRSRMLAARRAFGVGGWGVDGAHGLDGFALAIAQQATRMVGPVVARDAGTALALVAAAGAGATRVRVDVPAEQVEFAAALERMGFAVSKRRREMSRGGARLPWQTAARFGLAAQAFG